MRRRGFRLPLGGLVKGLPGWIRGGELGKALGRATVSVVPQRVRFNSGLSRDESNSTAFRVPVARSDDAFLAPTLALTHLWRNAGGLTWQPLGMLSLSGDLTSTRDLRVYPDRPRSGSLPSGFCSGCRSVGQDRSLVTAVVLTPTLASWLRPAPRGGSFVCERSPAGGTLMATAAPSSADAQQQPQQRARAAVDLGGWCASSATT
jgi:hypothetical protein